MIKKKAFESFNIHLEPTAASSIQLSSLSVFHDNGLLLAWFNHYKDNNNQGICKKQQFKNSEGWPNHTPTAFSFVKNVSCPLLVVSAICQALKKWFQGNLV